MKMNKRKFVIKKLKYEKGKAVLVCVWTGKDRAGHRYAECARIRRWTPKFVSSSSREAFNAVPRACDHVRDVGAFPRDDDVTIGIYQIGIERQRRLLTGIVWTLSPDDRYALNPRSGPRLSQLSAEINAAPASAAQLTPLT